MEKIHQTGQSIYIDLVKSILFYSLFRRKGLSAKEYFLLAVSTLVALGVFAGLITLAIFLVQNKEGSTASK